MRRFGYYLQKWLKVSAIYDDVSSFSKMLHIATMFEWIRSKCVNLLRMYRNDRFKGKSAEWSQKWTVWVDAYERTKVVQIGFSVIITKRIYEQYFEIDGGDLSGECQFSNKSVHFCRTASRPRTINTGKRWSSQTSPYGLHYVTSFRDNCTSLSRRFTHPTNYGNTWCWFTHKYYHTERNNCVNCLDTDDIQRIQMYIYKLACTKNI